jgi:hypothetical protein
MRRAFSREPFGFGRTAISFGIALLLTADACRLEAQGVRFERTGFRMTSIGEQITVSGRVLDARRRPVATGRVRFRIADPSVATVSPQGIVVSRKTGNTRLWAIAGRDSASALIVVDQWAAKFDFAPAVLRLDAVGAKASLRISVRDAEGHLINDQSRRSATCRSLNERVAVLTSAGEVTARGNGNTFVRCVDRGIADSVRVEVRQRPAKVAIANKTGPSQIVVGDTFRLRINASDRQGDAIVDPQSRWASLNPTIVSVDPVNGFARMIGAGTAKLVVQVGDVSDTATLAVAPGVGQPIPANNDSATTLDLTPREPALDIDPLSAREGDQATIAARARDARGNEVQNAPVSLRSSDTSIFVVEGGLRIRAKRTGNAYVHGRFGMATDSALVSIRSASTTTASADSSAARANRVFSRPTFPDSSLRAAYALSADSARNQMFRGSVVARGASGRMLSVNALGGTAAYTFTDSTGIEKRSGVIYGGAVDVAPFRWLKLGGDFKKGHLTTTESLGNPMALTEASAHVTVQAFGWLGVRGAYTVRALNDSIALQRWNMPSGSILIRLPLVGGRVMTVAGISMFAGSSYTGLPSTVKPDPLNLGGEAGIEFRTTWINATLLYAVEGLSVDEAGRADKFSSLRLRLGLQRGR